MGVKLSGLVSSQPVDYSELQGKIIAVDAPNIIFGLLNFSRKNMQKGEDSLIMDRTQRPISHLYGLIHRISFYYVKKVLPIFCFDGRVSPLKRVITKDLLNDFRYTRKRYQQAMDAGNRDQAKQIAMSSEYFWSNIVYESKKLLSYLGVPYLDSPASAESQCAHLVKKGIADFANSQDYDSLLFGCPSLLQNFTKSRRRKIRGKWTYQKIQPQLITLEKQLKMLGLDRFQVIDLCLLLKTDYFLGIQGIGPKTAYSLLKTHHSIERVIRKEKEQYDFSGLTPSLIKNVRKLFLMPEVLDSLPELAWSPPQISNAIQFLCSSPEPIKESHYLNQERVKKNLNDLEGRFHRCKTYFTKPRPAQKSITSFLKI